MPTDNSEASLNHVNIHFLPARFDFCENNCSEILGFKKLLSKKKKKTNPTHNKTKQKQPYTFSNKPNPAVERKIRNGHSSSSSIPLRDETHIFTNVFGPIPHRKPGFSTQGMSWLACSGFLVWARNQTLHFFLSS